MDARFQCRESLIRLPCTYLCVAKNKYSNVVSQRQIEFGSAIWQIADSRALTRMSTNSILKSSVQPSSIILPLLHAIPAWESMTICKENATLNRSSFVKLPKCHSPFQQVCPCATPSAPGLVESFPCGHAKFFSTVASISCIFIAFQHGQQSRRWEVW